MHYYQHHIGDFVKATANLNDHQLVTYLRMMWAYYDTEEPFDADSCDRIAFAMRSDEKTVSLILQHYFFLSEGKWHHARVDREISGYRSKADKARASANARWKNANALPSQSERNANERVLDANQEPITNKEKNTSAKASVRFAEFWSTWPSNPRKVAKAACLKKWESSRLDACADQIVASVKSLRDSKSWLDGYAPAPMTYLNQRRWEDGSDAGPEDEPWSTAL